MTPAIRIGDPVQVHDETEVLTVVCLDCGRAWVRDGAGRPQTRRLADLERARSKSYRKTDAEIDGFSPFGRSLVEAWFGGEDDL